MRLQLALEVDDLDAAVDFYCRMFGVEPIKTMPGYANFAIADPPLKLVLFGAGEPGTIYLSVSRQSQPPRWWPPKPGSPVRASRRLASPTRCPATPRLWTSSRRSATPAARSGLVVAQHGVATTRARREWIFDAERQLTGGVIRARRG